MTLFRRKTIISILLLLIFIILFANTKSIGRLMYPIKYEQDIRISAENFGIDPLLIAAIIRTESNYRPDLESSKKAIGLMQIMPETAEWIIDRARYSPQTMQHLKEPAINIEMGAWYIHWLRNRYEGQMAYKQTSEDLIAIVAAAYNAGHNKVGEWLREDVWDGRYETRSQIPYGETRHYIKRVMYYYNKYNAFYESESIELPAHDAFDAFDIGH